MEVYTRLKLGEAAYFLDELIKTEKNPESFRFNLSAFLSAWKSVLDVMLYDFAIYYQIGLTREDRMTYHDFQIVAYAEKNKPALEFYTWWNKKMEKMKTNPLWKMRNINVHRGTTPVFSVYTPATIASGSIVIHPQWTPLPPETGGALSPTDLIDYFIRDSFEVQYSEVVEKCKEGFALMEKIVEEAEENFGVHL